MTTPNRALVALICVFALLTTATANAALPVQLIPPTSSSIPTIGVMFPLMVVANKPTVLTVTEKFHLPYIHVDLPVTLELEEPVLLAYNEVNSDLYTTPSRLRLSRIPTATPLSETVVLAQNQNSETEIQRLEREAREARLRADEAIQRLRNSSASQPTDTSVRSTPEVPGQGSVRNDRRDEVFDAPRLLTVWDSMEKDLSPEQMAEFERREKEVTSPEDLVHLITGMYPKAYAIKADPKYAYPEDLQPETDLANPFFKDFKPFTEWATLPAGNRFADISEMRKDFQRVLTHIDEIQILGEHASQEMEIKNAWKRRLVLAMKYNWPFVLNLAKVDKPSLIWKQGSGRGGVTRAGYRLNLKSGQERFEVLRLMLLEIPLLVENGLECGGNANVVQTKGTVFRTEAVSAVCQTIQASVKDFTSEEQIGQYKPIMDQDVEVLKSEWMFGGSVVGNNFELTLRGSQVSETQTDLVYTGTVRAKGSPTTYTVKCSVPLVKRLPPPPPPIIPPALACDSVRVSVLENGQVEVVTNYLDEAGRLSKLVYFIDGRKVGESLHSPFTFRPGKEIIPGVRYAITVQGVDKHGNVLFTCPGDGQANTFEIPEVCPNCNVQGPKSLKINETATFTFALDNLRAEWVDYTVTLGGKRYSRADLTDDRLTINTLDFEPGTYSITLVGESRLSNGKTCQVRCDRQFTIKKKGSKKWLWILAAVGAGLAIFLLTRGGGKGALIKLDGDRTGNWNP